MNEQRTAILRAGLIMMNDKELERELQSAILQNDWFREKVIREYRRDVFGKSEWF